MEEKILQEARIEAEKVYPEQQYKGTYPYRQEGYIQGYIANAKKQMSEAVEFMLWALDDNRVEKIYNIHSVKELYELFKLFKQQKKE